MMESISPADYSNGLGLHESVPSFDRQNIQALCLSRRFVNAMLTISNSGVKAFIMP